MSTLTCAVSQLIHTVVSIYIIIIIISALLSFVRPDPYNPLVQAVYKLTEPVFQFVRSKVPFVVVSGLDLSPLVILLGLQFFDSVQRGILC